MMVCGVIKDASVGHAGKQFSRCRLVYLLIESSSFHWLAVLDLVCTVR